MKTNPQVAKAKTISEVCGQRDSAFQLLLAAKSAALKRMEARKDARIRAAMDAWSRRIMFERFPLTVV